MVAQAELAEYLTEIRTNVCSRCVERPEGGPPCRPLGKMCGVEMHLADLVKSIHQVRSNRIEPYLNHDRQEICEKCAFLHSDICPCPMDYLAVLVVEAIENVDKRRTARRGAVNSEGEVVEVIETANPRLGQASNVQTVDLEEIRRVYREATGTWAGCDWPTVTGKAGLNLQGWTAAQARAMAQIVQVEDWRLASDWLARIEHHAQLAEKRAAEAIKAASEGRWRDALVNAEWAWSLEFTTGRAFRHGPPLAWQRLRDVIEAAYLAHEVADISSTDTLS